MTPATALFRKLLLPLLLVFTLASCYQYKLLQPDQTTAALPETKLVFSYWWGIRSPTIKANTCSGNGFDRVTVKTNFMNSFVTLITLGIVSPMRVYWQCAPDPSTSPLEPRHGNLPR